MVELLRDRGCPVYCFIVLNNVPSMKMYESVGFKRAGRSDWFGLVGKGETPTHPADAGTSTESS